MKGGLIINIINSLSYTGNKAWDALDIADIEGASIRLHWTDKPYIWHKNDGNEVFVVLDGKINMRYRIDKVEQECILIAGDICFLRQGEEHIASPIGGVARVLVIEKKGSL